MISFTEEDVNGSIWKDVHPDAEFRGEAARSQKAFGDLMGQVAMSSEIAANLEVLERMKSKLADDSRRMLNVWTRNLRRGGAYLDPSKRNKCKNLPRRWLTQKMSTSET